MVAYQLFFFFQIKFKLVQAPPRLGEQDCSVWHCWGLPTPFSCCKQNLGYTLQEWVTMTVIQARLEHLLWPHVVTVVAVTQVLLTCLTQVQLCTDGWGWLPVLSVRLAQGYCP